MLFLIGSIVLSSWLTLSFKILERYRISVLQAIVVNYWVCVITGSFVNGGSPFTRSLPGQNWFLWALVMGTTFILLFNLIGFTAQRMGVSVASVSNKLSLVIPFLFSLVLYQEKATLLQILGVSVALGAVILTCWPSGNNEPSGKNFTRALLILPLGLFFGSGLLDTMIKYVETTYLNPANNNSFLITAFATAGAIGTVWMLAEMVIKKQKFDTRAIWGGIMIGVPNYFSIWCLVEVLKVYAAESSRIIPVNNMGIVLFSTLAAWMMFREHLSKTNWMGIAFSILAIALIAYG